MRRPLARDREGQLSVRNEDGICVIHLNPGAEIWRRETYHDTSALKPGDDVIARVTVAYPSGDLFADEVDANITITEGKIVSVRPDRIVVRDWHLPYLHGHVTVLLDRRTVFDLDGRELKKGAMVRAIGLDLGHNTFRATSGRSRKLVASETSFVGRRHALPPPTAAILPSSVIS